MKILSAALKITYLLNNSSVTITYENGTEGEILLINTEGDVEGHENNAIFTGFVEIEEIIKDIKSKINKIKINKL